MQLQRKNTNCMALALVDAHNVGILHRDFSPGNVIIIDDGTGRLIDWDLSKPRDMEKLTPRCATQMVWLMLLHVVIGANSLKHGMWQFMSARLIGNMEGPHVLADDLESLIYILLWMALMYSECSDITQVPSFMEHVIDPQPHHNTGGYGKTDILQARTFFKMVKFPN